MRISEQDAGAASSLRQALLLLHDHQTGGTSSDRFTLELQATLARLNVGTDRQG